MFVPNWIGNLEENKLLFQQQLLTPQKKNEMSDPRNPNLSLLGVRWLFEGFRRDLLKVAKTFFLLLLLLQLLELFLNAFDGKLRYSFLCVSLKPGRQFGFLKWSSGSFWDKADCGFQSFLIYSQILSCSTPIFFHVILKFHDRRIDRQPFDRDIWLRQDILNLEVKKYSSGMDYFLSRRGIFLFRNFSYISNLVKN